MKKKVVSGLLAVCLVCGVSGTRAAAADFVVPANDNLVQNGNIQTYTDIIIKKFRTHNGKRQYRHWNDRKQCWIEPHWIDV